jgi:para-nitrobenzyl esterase
VIDTFQLGLEAPVPYIIGTNEIEFPKMGGPIANHVPTFASLPPDLKAAYGSEAEYQRTFISDALLVEPAMTLAELHARKAKSYVYFFTALSDDMKKQVSAAPHASELPYVFQTEALPAKMDDRDRARASEIATYWTNFGKSGTPSAPGLPAWPLASGGSVILFSNEKPRVVPHPSAVKIKAIRDESGKSLTPLIRPTD